MLDSGQVDFYREHGYLMVPDLLDAAELAEVRREAERIVAGAQGVAADNEVYDFEDSHRPERPRVRRIKEPHAASPVFARLLRHPRLLSVYAALLGPDVRLKTSKLNMKAAEYGAPVEWHQDWAFYPHTNDDLLALGLMLDDVDDENGPLLVIPGSHRGPTFDHHSNGVFCGAMDIAAAAIDPAQAVRLTGRAGSASVHHVRLVHGSDLNRTPRPRRLLFYEMAAADAWPLCGTTTKFTELEAFDAKIVAGTPTTLPRMRDIPIRIPLPKHDLSSIYNAQKQAGSRFFSRYAQETNGR
ncbi:MAG: phytanoyl-CoA dioxygenase family protein [Burkholderiales bacterium]|nr:phytanoyl-CoA dioxygenase family protein [Burkholderiales bacterium]